MESAYIEIKNLSKRYCAKNGSVEALKDVSLAIPKNEIFGIIGLSGAGKSTLVRCINLLERPDSGEVYIDGENLLTLNQEQLRLRRQKIGMIFQHFNLLEQQTVLNNVCFPLEIRKIPAKQRKEKALELLHKVGLEDKANAYPSQLSGGQKQRVAIVRALIMHPEILLLDEITAALDPEMVHEVLEVVLSLARSGSTMLIVTHEMAFAKAIADRVLFIEHGEIVEQSHSPKAFFEQPATQRAQQFLRSFEY